VFSILVLRFAQTTRTENRSLVVGPDNSLTVLAGFGSVRAMTAIDEGEYPGTARRKHRHDLGHEDHGPKLAAGTTWAIQMLLGLWIALTLVLVVYAVVGSAGPPSATTPAAGSAATPG
jgi:hypothetical protein